MKRKRSLLSLIACGLVACGPAAGGGPPSSNPGSTNPGNGGNGNNVQDQQLSLRLNLGGPAQTISGVAWQECTSASSCQDYVAGGAPLQSLTPAAIKGVQAPANAAIYQTGWAGNFAVQVPVKNGTYLLRLHFAELNEAKPGKRQFRIHAEDHLLSDQVDIVQEAGGQGRALILSWPVTVNDGTLNLKLTGKAGDALLNGLELLPQAKSSLAWQGRAAAPSTLYEGQGAVVGGRLYVFGGFDKNVNNKPISTRAVRVYDPALDTWATLKDMPEGLTHAGVAVDGSFVYLAGGFVGNHPGPQTEHVWRYDMTQDTWQAMPSLPRALGAGALVRLGRELHFFGGTERSSQNLHTYLRDSAEHWILNLDKPESWQSAPPLLQARNHLSAVELNGLIYAIGGQHLGDEAHGNLTTVEIYDPQRGTWRKGTPLPIPLSHILASTVAWRGTIIVGGGVTQRAGSGTHGSHSGNHEGQESEQVWQYDPATERWSALTALPAERQSPIMGVINDALILTTGSDASGPMADTWVSR